jgi:hypothetical protein
MISTSDCNNQADQQVDEVEMKGREATHHEERNNLDPTDAERVGLLHAEPPAGLAKDDDHAEISPPLDEVGMKGREATHHGERNNLDPTDAEPPAGHAKRLITSAALGKEVQLGLQPMLAKLGEAYEPKEVGWQISQGEKGKEPPRGQTDGWDNSTDVASNQPMKGAHIYGDDTRTGPSGMCESPS